MTFDRGSLDRLVTRADALAGAWGARARGSTTVGQERAILRLFGVSGLDASGRPLAGTTVDRWLAGEPRALGNGIALPFAMALLEYDLEPQQLARDVASGAIDLTLESELLREHDRRAVAEAEAGRLAAMAVERIDAQRTVRRETIAMLGEADRPWLGVTLREPDVDAAIEEVAGLIAAGIDLIRIEVPIGRELADRMIGAGLEVPIWQPREPRRGAANPASEPAPSGSQRAIARLRRAVDRAAAKRQAYVRLATVAPALGAPEGAVVAAFERVDLIASDAMAEIVGNAVEPDRALADHAFAHRLAKRAGTSILVGPGPLVVAPDLSSGVPSDPATRAGRALALQLLGVTLARGDGLAADQIVVGALTPWLTDEPSPGARAIAEVAVRRALFAGHPLGFVEPPTGTGRSVLWSYVQAAAAVHGGDIAMVLRSGDAGPEDVPASARSARAAAQVSTDVAAASAPGSLTGVALDHARGMIDAAMRTLDGLAEHGWRTIAGEPPGGPRARSAVRDVVTEQTETFDPFESALGPRA
ncbi:MAG TPA: lysine 5,6-aminomutase subunit alpha [Candidatus Limnocylindrales bacterium]|nr:lysine 5,6-aminomutase subunit alpha [Candidatus Limnocylindrales bacterium]